MDLKEINPSLKVLLAVGGSKENAYMFDEGSLSTNIFLPLF